MISIRGYENSNLVDAFTIDENLFNLDKIKLNYSVMCKARKFKNFKFEVIQDGTIINTIYL